MDVEYDCIHMQVVHFSPSRDHTSTLTATYIHSLIRDLHAVLLSLIGLLDYCVCSRGCCATNAPFTHKALLATCPR